jgi:rubrerythrin
MEEKEALMFVFGTADDVFTMAVRIEENGETFYSGVAESNDDPQIKKLFEDLAAMESGHIAQFKALRGKLADSLPADAVWDPEGLAESYLQSTADTHVFTLEAASDRLKQVKTPLQALDLALQFEKDSVTFFVGVKEILPDPKGKDEIDKLIKAEMDHIRMISAAKKQFASTGAASIS